MPIAIASRALRDTIRIMGAPSYDPATLAEYFSPLSASLFDDVRIGPILRRLAAEDPDCIAAVADVDRSQVRAALALSPELRLSRAVARWNGLARFRRGG
jgi:hypothetical protein